MADWTYTPDYPGNVVELEPPTIIETYEDGAEQRREKHSTGPRVWSERYVFDGDATARAVRNFWKARRLLVNFTRVTWDPADTNPDTDEATVRFLRRFQVRRTAFDVYEARIQMIEDL